MYVCMYACMETLLMCKDKLCIIVLIDRIIRW